MRPCKPRSTKLSEVEEAAVVELHRRMLVPLDDITGCSRQIIPQLSRSDEKDSRRGRFPGTPPGCGYIDSCAA